VIPEVASGRNFSAAAAENVWCRNAQHGSVRQRAVMPQAISAALTFA